MQVACEYADKMLKRLYSVYYFGLEEDSGYEHSLKILATKNDVIAIRVLDDSELELPRAGILSLQDPKNRRGSLDKQFRFQTA